MKYIDLGLPSGTLWADRNVGAQNPEEYGDHLDFDEAQKHNSPTEEQITELLNLKSEWTTLNGVKGRRFYGKNGNSIFLPAGGYDRRGAELFGYYWSSTQYPYNSYYAYSLYFYSSSASINNYNRYYGQSVRPVKMKGGEQ